MTEMYAEVNGIKICYEIHGEGEPIILVHGWGGSKDGWFVQVGALSKYFKVIIFDNRGAGKSSRPNYPYTMDMYAEDINGLLEFLNIERTHLLGESLGGMIALNFILKYPKRVNKFILINSWPGFPNEQGPEMYSRGKITYFEELKNDPLNAFLKAAKASYSREFFKMMEENPKKKFFGLWSVEDLVKIDLTNPSTLEDNNNAANAVYGHNVTERLHEIRSPTLLICGEKDRIATLSVQRKIHENILNSIFKVIKDARHGVSKEKAPEVNEAIINFLKN
ncbi:MAG: alpha/beta fold hydrolase [Candidatus Hodarchaeota archaeon]